MGKPAARLTDTTAHGGTIVGPGTPTVLIGSMPAATLGDMHVCPMMTGPVPHVGGPITLGSTGVFLGKKPAARMGDMATCVGPPSSILMGCMTVMIGEAGSGSQAASAGAAAEASLAGLSDPSSIEPFPLLAPPPETDELHWCRFRFVDSAGKSLPGIAYTWESPNGESLQGMSDPEGRSQYSGFPQAGSFTVKPKQISSARWALSECEVGEEVGLEAVFEGYPEGTTAVVSVAERSSAGRMRFVSRFQVQVQGTRLQANWRADIEELETYVPVADTREREETRYVFIVYSEGGMAVSNELALYSRVQMEVVDEHGEAAVDKPIKIIQANGQSVSLRSDSRGLVDVGGIQAGKVLIPSKEIGV